MAAEAVFYNAYIAFLISIAVSNGQMNCYMLDDGEDIRVVRVLPSDLQPRCDGDERYITIVCHTDAQLYEEDRPTWLHTTIDCGELGLGRKGLRVYTIELCLDGSP